jgi:hypothetical protein
MSTREKVRSCKTNRLIGVGGNVYRALERSGYFVSDKTDKDGMPFFDHPTENNKCHPRRAGKSPRAAKGKRSPKGQGRAKRVLQEGEPKRPGSSFTLFQSALLEKLRSQYSAEQLKGQAARMVRDTWARTSQAEKDRWAAVYRQRAEEYKQALAAFEAQGGVRTPRATAAKAVPKRKATPKAIERAAVQQAVGKRPVTGYIKFSQDMRPEIVQLLTTELGRAPKVTEVAKRTGEYWRSNAATQAAYNAQQAPLMEQYKATKQEVVGAQPARQKRSQNAYIIFSNEMRSRAQAETGVSPGRAGLGKTTPRPQDVSRRLGEMWRSLSAAQKAPYEARAAELAAAAGIVPKSKTPKTPRQRKTPAKKASPKSKTPKARTPRTPKAKTPLVALAPLSPPRAASPLRRVSSSQVGDLLSFSAPRVASPSITARAAQVTLPASLSPARVASVPRSPARVASVPRSPASIGSLGGIEVPPAIEGILDDDFAEVPLMKPKTGLPSRRRPNY